MKAIMYHYVRPKDKRFPGLYRLDIESFKKQLDFFDSNFGFIDRKCFVDAVKFNKNISNGVILTFDDGLSCHYEFVFKELKKRNLWGIFYIPTMPFQMNKVLDVHKIHILLSLINPKNLYDYLTMNNIKRYINEDKIAAFQELTYWNQKNNKYTLLVKRILNYFIEYKYRAEIIDSLFKFFIKKKININDYYLTSENLKEMHNEGMVIGSHSVNHNVMSTLSKNDQRYEIEESFNFIEKTIGSTDLKTFCYPYGGFHSFNKNSENILTKIKVDFSFNVESRDIMKRDVTKRPQALPRYDCNEFQFGENSNS